MKITEFIKTILSPYSDKVKTDFKPLEYIEVMRSKPLIIKLSEKYMFKCELQSINDFLLFNESKTIIFKNLETLNDKGEHLVISQSKIVLFKMLIKVLFEISKREYNGVIAKYRYFKFLNKYLFDNIEVLYDITDKVLRYNSRLKKKALNLLNFQIFQSESLMTAGGQQLSDLLKTDPVTGEKSLKH